MVTQAANGEEALRIAATQVFDMVITDVNMPVMDGLTLTRNLRQLPAYRTIPMIALTTEATAEVKRNGREAGATAWVVKQPNSEVVAFSPQCTHLGCAYHWDAPSHTFICPCHTSVFSIDGKVLGVMGKSGKQLGQFGWIHEMACPSENELYVAEILNWRVQKLVLEPNH